MIKIEEALEKILDGVEVLGEEAVGILDCLCRVLAEDIYAGTNLPPFDNSAMDGYAVRSTDLKGVSKENPGTLKVIEEIKAGDVPKEALAKGVCCRIMTGAPIPEGADSVIMVEDTEADSREEVRIFKQTGCGENIRRAGEDVKEGDLVISKGVVIRPAEVGMLAALGKRTVRVVKRPRVAILTTGNELVDIEEEVGPAKIRNSNGYALYALILKYGGIPLMLQTARDSRDEIRRKIEQGIKADMLLVSGGVSVGEYDLVREVMKELGVEMRFYKVAIKPGKPLAFGLIDKTPVFGLPGNPVSSMITFEIFVRPALLAMSGRNDFRRTEVRATIKEEIRKKPGWRHYLRAQVEYREGRGYATLTGPQGSGILSSLIKANGLIIIGEEVTMVESGSEVLVRLLD